MTTVQIAASAWYVLIALTVEVMAGALVGIALQLKRLNTGRDAFHAEVLAVLSDAKPSGETQASGIALPHGWCVVCGRAIGDLPCTEVGPLTREQWFTHHAFLSDQERKNGESEVYAEAYATERTYELFGPPADAPEEGG